MSTRPLHTRIPLARRRIRAAVGVNNRRTVMYAHAVRGRRVVCSAPGIAAGDRFAGRVSDRASSSLPEGRDSGRMRDFCHEAPDTTIPVRVRVPVPVRIPELVCFCCGNWLADVSRGHSVLTHQPRKDELRDTNPSWRMNRTRRGPSWGVGRTGGSNPNLSLVID